MNEVVAYETLFEELRHLSEGALIGIEGYCESGKTTLADRLAADLPAQVIHTDRFSDKFESQPPYMNCLRIDELRRTLANRSNGKTLIEGICLRDVLKACGAEANFVVYVKRLGKNGRWHDRLHLEDFERGDEDAAEPHLSALEYHSRERPHERADLIFRRVEED